VGGFLVGQVGGAVLVELAAGVEGKTRHLSAIEVMASPPEWYIVSSLVGLWCGFGLAPLLASRLRGSGRFVADLGVRFRWIDTIGIGIGVGGQVLVAVLYAPFINHLHNFSAPTQKLTGSAHGWGFFVIALFTVVGAPFFEELYFRGLLFRALVRLFSPSDTARRTAAIVSVGPAVLLDAMLFGLAHGEAEQFAGLAVFGAILAYVSYRTGRQGMNMVAHASFNLVAVLAIVANGGGVIH
jgi:membrane protease YdiL (CAAX protease family)